jgi:hypothetical protein
VGGYCSHLDHHRKTGDRHARARINDMDYSREAMAKKIQGKTMCGQPRQLGHKRRELDSS